MKNRLFSIIFILFLLWTVSCRKDLIGNAITVELSTNDTLSLLRFYKSCEAGPNGMPIGAYSTFDEQGNGNYSISVEKGYENTCFLVAGDIPENNDSSGTTVLNIHAFYTNEGNVVGFKEFEIKRPHGEYRIRYKFHSDTYLQE